MAQRAGKLILMSLMIVAFLVQGAALSLIYRAPALRRRRLSLNASRWSRRALKLLGFEIETRGAVAEAPTLFVMNHMSYLDILIFSGRVPSVFVTSVDMGQVPLLGQMAEIGGSLFIERRHRERLDYDVDQIAATLLAGHQVVLFPEGTSTNGDEVKQFKRGLLPAAGRAGCMIQPVTLKYESINGRPFSKENCDEVCWYGEMGFAKHFIGLMKFTNVKASMQFHEPIRFAADACKTEIAQACQTVVSDAYKISDARPPLFAAR